MSFSSLQIMTFYWPQPQPDLRGTDGLAPVATQPQPDAMILVGAADPQQLEAACSYTPDGTLLDCVAIGPLEILHAEMSPIIAKQVTRMSTICLVRYLI